MEKESYSYSAKLTGVSHAGEVLALSLDDARESLEKMGFTHILVNNVKTNQSQVPKTEKAMDKMIGSLSKQVSDQQEDNNNLQSKRTVGKVQKIVTGGASILGMINMELAGGFSSVAHVTMHPDSQGKMQYLFVLEGDMEN